jgi:NTE family protein
MSSRIAITLGASFLGYATHAGFLARLHELGIRPVHVGGSSAGAIAAGLYAAGLSAEKIREIVLSWDLRLSFVKRTKWFTHYVRNTFYEPYPAVFKPDAAVDFLEGILGDRQIEDLKDPTFMAAVTDIDENHAHFLQSGSLARAMIASCCVPTIFSPLMHQGMRCFDGGVVHEAPFDPWLEDDSVDTIILHQISHTTHSYPKFIPFNLFKLTAQAHGCASRQLLEYRLRLAQIHGKKVIITTTTHDRPPVFSGKRMPDFYEAGVQQAQTFYDQELKPLIEQGMI